jgi:hypothetical protein
MRLPCPHAAEGAHYRCGGSSLPSSSLDHHHLFSFQTAASFANTPKRPAARIAPELCQNHPPEEGVGNAGCPLHPWAPCEVSTGVGPQVHRESPGIPARNGFNGFLRALPGDRAFLSPSSARCESIIANLTPASGRQDHTTSPSAKAHPQKPARRVWYRFRRSSCEGRSASPSRVAVASTASRSNVRDDRETPL